MAIAIRRSAILGMRRHRRHEETHSNADPAVSAAGEAVEGRHVEGIAKGGSEAIIHLLALQW